MRLLHLRLDLRLQRLQLLFLDAALPQPPPQPRDRVAPLPLLHFFPCAIGEIAHALGVRPGAVRPAFEQGRPAAVARPADRLARRRVDRRRVVAVHLGAGQAVAGGPRRHAGVAGRVGERHLGGVLVVFADEKDRQFPDGGQVQPFVEGPVVDRPVAEEGDGDALRLQELEAVAGPRRLEDARPDDAARAHQADFGREKVHTAAAAVGAAGLAAVQLGDQLPRRHALGQRVAVAAVGAERPRRPAAGRRRRRRRPPPGRRRCGRRRGSGRAGATAPAAPRSGGSAAFAGKGTGVGLYPGTAGLRSAWSADSPARSRFDPGIARCRRRPAARQASRRPGSGLI